MIKKLLVVLVVVLASNYLEAQQIVADSISLTAAEIVENRLPDSNPGLNQIQIRPTESSQSAYSLAELIGRSSAAFVKQYSPGSLASPSLRGTGAAHTALIWNGLNLQSSMNGQLDLSLIPGILFDEFRIQEGAGAASWGSGAIGGSIFLNSNTSNKNNLRFQYTIGSWGFQQRAIDASYGKGRIRLRTRAYQSTNQNNFKFVNDAVFGHPIERQSNAKQNSFGFIQDFSWHLGKQTALDFAIWHQQSMRHIPPILSVPVSVAKQKDKSTRISASLHKQFKNLDLKLRSGYLAEQIHFVDSLFHIDSDNNAKSIISEGTIGWDISPKKQRFEFGGNYTSTRAIAQGYGAFWKAQQRISLFTSLKSSWLDSRLLTLVQFRQEIVNGKVVMPTPSISGDLKLSNKFHLKSQVARTYRIPTLNDLYWIPGGNPDLKPEDGMCYESSVHFAASPTKWNIQSSLGVFANQINNWIIWTPGNSYWTPQNIHTVFSRGAEFKLIADVKPSKNLTFTVNTHTQFVKSTVEANLIHPDYVGKQLIYTPELTSNSSLSADYKGYKIHVVNLLVGHRYITTNNSDYLPAYQVWNATFSKEVQWRKTSLNIYIQANNFTNTNYQNVVWRPMPLRSWMTGLTLNLKS
jgi:vitamin B12 transporter